MLCITANDQTDSNKFDSEHKDIDSNFAKPEKKEVERPTERIRNPRNIS